jgi:thioredoxin-like negative regulator of GroEL
VEALAQEYAGRIRVGKCDIDSNPMVPTQLEIRSIPSLLMFRSGQVVGQVVGAVPRARILDLVNKAL